MSKKIRALSAVMAAVMAFCTMPVSAYEHIGDLPTDYTQNVRLNKPYLNFGVKAGEDVDVTDMKFVLKDKNGKRLATFTGGGEDLTILDSSLLDFTDIHSEEDLKKYSYSHDIPVDPLVPDPDKSTYPYGEMRTDKNIKSKSDDGNYYIAPYEHCYYYFTDPKKFEVVDKMTLPANTGFVDVDSNFLSVNNKRSYLELRPEDGMDCDLKGEFKFYEHAGTVTKFKADTGKHPLWTVHSCNTDQNLEIYDEPVSYTKVRVKFLDVFPGLADSDLKVTKSYDFDGGYTIVFDLRGDQNANTITALYYSGSAVSVFVPDKDGYVEFWVDDRTRTAKFAYGLEYGIDTDGIYHNGSTSYLSRQAMMPKSIEDINFVFEYPQAGFCLYNLEPGDYKLVIDDKADSRDYRLNQDTITVTDTKQLQRFTATVNKKPLLLGDCNRDGVIDVTDIAIIAAHVKGVKKLDGRGPLTADVDESKLINITDVSTIAAHVKGKKLIPEKWV